MTHSIQKHYANILSLFNLICWIIALFLIFENHYLLWILFFFFWQFFDMFDGKFARKYWSTKHWALYDDVADAVSFWFLPWITFLSIYWVNNFSIFVAGIYMISVFYRLWRFVKKDAFNKTIKKWNFRWLPSPAWAFISLSFMLTESNIYITSLVVFISSLLMISTIPFAHFWKIIFKKINKEKSILFSIITLFIFLLAQKLANIDIFFFYTFFLWMSYIVLWWLYREK